MFADRRFASVCLIVIVCLSLFFGTLRSLNSLRDDVLYSFGGKSGSGIAFADYKAVDKNYVDVRTDLSKLTSQASELLSIYEATIGGDETFLSFQDSLFVFVSADDDPFGDDFADAFKSLMQSAGAAYYKLDIMLDSEKDAQLYNSATAYYREMRSTVMRIQNNGAYLLAVIKYNSAVSSPHGKIAAGVFNMKKAADFK